MTEVRISVQVDDTRRALLAFAHQRWEASPEACLSEIRSAVDALVVDQQAEMMEAGGDPFYTVQGRYGGGTWEEADWTGLSTAVKGFTERGGVFGTTDRAAAAACARYLTGPNDPHRVVLVRVDGSLRPVGQPFGDTGL